MVRLGGLHQGCIRSSRGCCCNGYGVSDLDGLACSNSGHSLYNAGAVSLQPFVNGQGAHQVEIIRAGQDSSVDDFHAKVYELHGGVTHQWDGEKHLYAIVSMPGIITKFEPLQEAINRLNEYIEAKHETI